jgi:serine/threonine-protein kinase RsbT
VETSPEPIREVRGGVISVPIRRDVDIAAACVAGRSAAAAAGCRGIDQTLVATAIAEVARNMLVFARGGVVEVAAVEQGGCSGVEVTAVDHGPGIEDLDLAFNDGYSTGAGLGVGLPGVRRLMDELVITTAAGAGTVLVMRKWCAARGRRGVTAAPTG